ncbi:MHYT domain-containing protein [Streptomyces hainanensis]|uniref:MHYT domain-containing protein n=1 Tax=Streptomyces hainanensis TaxID=402648 RepID=UPI001404486E|nr:MHYT domain-containing protein [Streptomyces hainanensis]
MHGDVSDFGYGAITPVAAFLMACLGGALGLRCVARSVHYDEGWKPGWLAMGATAMGCGIWSMHFIAMVGFGIDGARVGYDVTLTVWSLVVAILVVGVGVFVVGYRGASRPVLAVAGTFTGLGVAAMHYLGMAAIRFNGEIRYDPFTVALSVLIAVAAATAALWAAVSVRGVPYSLAASLVMGVAVTGMHYTGMAAVSAELHGAGHLSASGDSPVSLLLPMLVGPAVFLVLAAVVITLDPLLVLGDGEWNDGRRDALGSDGGGHGGRRGGGADRGGPSPVAVRRR